MKLMIFWWFLLNCVILMKFWWFLKQFFIVFWGVFLCAQKYTVVWTGVLEILKRPCFGHVGILMKFWCFENRVILMVFDMFLRVRLDDTNRISMFWQEDDDEIDENWWKMMKIDEKLRSWFYNFCNWPKKKLVVPSGSTCFLTQNAALKLCVFYMCQFHGFWHGFTMYTYSETKLMQKRCQKWPKMTKNGPFRVFYEMGQYLEFPGITESCFSVLNKNGENEVEIGTLGLMRSTYFVNKLMQKIVDFWCKNMSNLMVFDRFWIRNNCENRANGGYAIVYMPKHGCTSLIPKIDDFWWFLTELVLSTLYLVLYEIWWYRFVLR